MDVVGRLVRDGVAVGTAFIVTADGLAATAAHVIGPHPEAEWTFEPLTVPGVSLPVDAALPSDAAADLALLQVGAAAEWQPMALVSHTSATPGDPVHLRGFAASRDYDSGVGHYVGVTAETGRAWVKVSCRHAQPGMSGAPVLLTGTGGVIGVVSARLNAERWNRDTVLLSCVEDLVALAPERLRLRLRPTAPADRFIRGTLRLSWVRGNRTELLLETDDFTISFGRSSASRVYLPDPRDSRFHGHLSLVGTTLVYQHLGSRPAFLAGATRQLRIAKGDSCPVGDKDRISVASGTMLVEFSAPDLYDPNAAPTASEDDDETETETEAEEEAGDGR
ncbi:trypsin-like peptidase domain-containing protein [Kitasatospora acidiphila]|uniref:Trypsin-like peptidase domain-containing protein n=1 Tax=Kitasatospora acidiphila TaxID=2567942 RepID=A0A540W042_9ACTN|nr:trypsin-like peptidase domain-containing protein [Kitasatospora acidiphila]TQF02389.1 trypsin-like peptidase domain-containing protein [Kitasatospora acidiphila]